MKTIVLIPAKNEEWILESTLRNTAPHVDLIIIADQNSTDKTVEICKKFPNVTVINNPNQGHSNRVRWLLLDEARKHGDNNLIICIDADEMISPLAITEMKKMVSDDRAANGDVFEFKWIQLWKTTSEYRDDGVWKNSFKNIAFIDNPRINEYNREFIINDHTSRVPDTKINNTISISYPLLHFHFVAWKRNQLKQAWYRCSELIAGKRNAKRINNTYRVTMMPENIKTFPVENKWIEGLIMPTNLENTGSEWHLNEIFRFFDEKGIEFFEQLQIWHVDELHDEFIKRVGREPISKTYPKWLSSVNEIKNFIKNFRFK
jgi:glycosyltransferase involved in cell wall biosynthesis